MLTPSPGGPSPQPSPAGRGNSASVALVQELLPLKGVETGEGAAKDQSVHFVRALIGVDRLQVQHVADDRELERNAAGAVDRARHTGNVERLGHTILLGHAHLVRGQAILVFECVEIQSRCYL
jgi:hypothetical protein